MRSSLAFSARPSTPIVSGCRVQSSGVAMDRYWWIRAKTIGCVKVAARRRGRLERRLAVRDADRVAREHVAHVVLVEAGRARRAERDQQRRRLLAVRVVGGEEDLLRGDVAEDVEQVDGAPDGGVEEDARLAAEALGERGQVGDARVGDDQLRLRVRVDEAREVVGDRRQAASAVDEDRNPPLGGQLEDRRKPLVVEEEALRARMELDPAGAEVEAAIRLADRILAQVEPDERDEPSFERFAYSSVRSFGARKPGWRSGSSMQNMKEREIP